MTTHAFRRAHYTFLAERVRVLTTLGVERDDAVALLCTMLFPLDGFKPDRFKQACYADDPARATATKSRAASTTQRRRMASVDSGQS